MAPLLLSTVTAPLVEPSVNALPLLVSIVPLLVSVPPLAFIVMALSEDTVVFVATVVPDDPEVVVTVPEPPVFRSIVVAETPSDWKVNKPELGVIEILPAVLTNLPVAPLPPSTVSELALDGDVTEIALPEVASVIVRLDKSTIDDDKVNVLLDVPGLNDILFAKLNLLLAAVPSVMFPPAVYEPVPDIVMFAPEVVSVSCMVNAPPEAIVAPLSLTTANGPLVDSIVKALPLLVSIVPLFVKVLELPPLTFSVIGQADDNITPLFMVRLLLVVVTLLPFNAIVLPALVT